MCLGIPHQSKLNWNGKTNMKTNIYLEVEPQMIWKFQTNPWKTVHIVVQNCSISYQAILRKHWTQILSNHWQEPGSGKIFRHIDFLTSHSYLLIYLLLLLFESFTKSFTLYFLDEAKYIRLLYITLLNGKWSNVMICLLFRKLIWDVKNTKILLPLYSCLSNSRAGSNKQAGWTFAENN